MGRVIKWSKKRLMIIYGVGAINAGGIWIVFGAFVINHPPMWAYLLWLLWMIGTIVAGDILVSKGMPWRIYPRW